MKNILWELDNTPRYTARLSQSIRNGVPLLQAVILYSNLKTAAFLLNQKWDSGYKFEFMSILKLKDGVFETISKTE